MKYEKHQFNLTFVFFLLQNINANQKIKSCNIVPDSVVAIYKELKCKIELEGDCIRKYDCSAYFKNKKAQTEDEITCFYNGKHYRQGHYLKDESDSCLTKCICARVNSRVQFLCVFRECTGCTNLEEDMDYNTMCCLNVYERESSCATRKLCKKKGFTETNAICRFKEKLYTQGQYINIESECKKCLCTENLQGLLDREEFIEPWCNSVKCDIQKQFLVNIQDSCAPIFENERACCPKYWYCADGKEQIVPSSQHRSIPDETCRVGKTKVKTNQDFIPSKSQCLTCTCALPPLTYCYIKENCSNSIT